MMYCINQNPSSKQKRGLDEGKVREGNMFESFIAAVSVRRGDPGDTCSW